MAITEAYSGTHASWAVEYSLTNASTTLANQTSPGVYQLFVDLSALASGDTYTLRVYEKVRSTSARRIVIEHVVVGAQATPVWAFPALTLLNGWDFSIIGTGSTTRSIDWSIRKVA